MLEFLERELRREAEWSYTLARASVWIEDGDPNFWDSMKDNAFYLERAWEALKEEDIDDLRMEVMAVATSTVNAEITLREVLGGK